MDLIKAIWGQNISMNLLKYSNLSCKMVLGLKVTNAVALMLKVTTNTNHWYNVQEKCYTIQMQMLRLKQMTWGNTVSQDLHKSFKRPKSWKNSIQRKLHYESPNLKLLLMSYHGEPNLTCVYLHQNLALFFKTQNILKITCYSNSILKD